MSRYVAFMELIKRLPEPLRSVVGLAVVLGLAFGFWSGLFGVLYLSKLLIGGVATLVLFAVVVTWIVVENRST